jgi:hypothetical protein
MRAKPWLAGAVLLMSTALAAQPASPASPPLDWDAIADRIVAQMALRPGERVLLVADPAEFPELRPLLRQRVMRAGAVDLGCWEVLPQAQGSAELAAASQKSRERMKGMLRDVDLAVMLPGASPEDAEYAAMQDLLKEGHGRTIHFHWRGGGSPSAMAVPGHPLPPDAEIDAFYQKALLGTDYAALGESQRRFEAALRAGEVRVTTPAGTDLRFRVGDRPVNRQDGDASAARAAAGRILIDREIELPAGVIRVAPLEESVEGTIAFPPASWNGSSGQTVEGLKLRFARGKVVEVSATAGKDAVDAELAQGGGAARSFREFALGLNPALAIPAANPWIPYYGYGAGVVRLSLGDNSELGGTVKGDYVRWNFFHDATVTVGGEVWVREGKLVRR